MSNETQKANCLLSAFITLTDRIIIKSELNQSAIGLA